MDLAVFDISEFLEISGNLRDTSEWPQSLTQLCERMAACLRDTSALVIRDPRCLQKHNDEFLDMMEKYFEQPTDVKMKHSRPELHYQVGVTPEGTEMPQAAMDESVRRELMQLPEEDRPHLPDQADCKWRFMWRVGPRPDVTQFKELNAAPVLPEGFPSWQRVMDGWGTKMVAATQAVATMLAVGFHLPAHAFTSLMDKGPHLLAPTGSDLVLHGQPGTVLAGYHSDLNFLTIHGRCRFPGLFIWLRDGRRVRVTVPEGCLLLQAGKQMEWLTAGEVRAGMHEVVVSESTMQAVERARLEGRSCWRVSSTVFAHIASDAILQPLGGFESSTCASKYLPTVAGTFVEKELASINLKVNAAG